MLLTTGEALSILSTGPFRTEPLQSTEKEKDVELEHSYRLRQSEEMW